MWCGFHDIDWKARQRDTGFWVRRSAQGRNIATESTNAMLRYAFGALGMCRVGRQSAAARDSLLMPTEPRLENFLWVSVE